jgi:hypothetical protein
MYANGRGVPEDDREAVRWYRKAAEGGNPQAQLSLGVMYEHGRGAPRNDTEALKWYRMAAEQGDATTQSYLGAIYAEGTGVPKDLVQAYAWWNIAGAQGIKQAVVLKGLARRLMTPDQVAEAQKLSRELWVKIPNCAPLRPHHARRGQASQPPRPIAQPDAGGGKHPTASLGAVG